MLQVERLTTVFDLGDREAAAVRTVSFVIRAGETRALVGESGSGKSVTALSLLGLVPPPGRITGGSILWKGLDLARLDDTRLHRIRGREIALMLQDPGAALNPVFTIGDQIIETLLAHGSRRGRGRAAGCSSSSPRSGFRTRTGAPTTIRTSCPVVCVSVS